MAMQLSGITSTDVSGRLRVNPERETRGMRAGA
jgi:hypothetical protein